MKKVHSKIYIHKSAIPSEGNIPKRLQSTYHLLPHNYEWNIVRLDKSDRISFLYYPNFYDDPHPSLKHSLIVDVNLGETKIRNYSTTNPPILHRKETFLTSHDKNYTTFSALTIQEEKAGLLDSSINHIIGHKKQWEELLNKRGFKIINHELLSVNQHNGTT